MMHIGSKTIGRNAEPYIIAEVGINHCGDLTKAFELVEIAAQSGADAVKFQTFSADEFVSDPAETYTYRSEGREVTESMLAMFKRHEFSRDSWQRIRDKCNETGITFLSTPQNESDCALLLAIGISAIKIGSDDFTNIPLLKAYAAHGLPLLLSCGMADLGDVHTALDAVGALDGKPTVLFVCTSQYPTLPQNANLRRLQSLAAAYPQLILGFSDHTIGTIAAGAAVALGATVFEKHFTLSHELAGPDHWFSSDPGELKEWVHHIRTAYTMLGDGIVRPSVDEIQMRRIARRSIVALREILPDELFTTGNLGLKRPGTGLAPIHLETILGRRAKKAIEKNQILTLGDID